jgi:type I restriction enzyme S subunit
MDSGLKPYPGYKKTELLWLDSVPEHWELKKIKHLFTERVEKGYPEEPLLAATQTKGVVPKNLYESRTVTAEKDLHLLKLVKVGDFVISLRSFQGGIEYAYYQGIISPAYTVIVPNSEINRGYFRHLAKSRLFLELLKLCVTGIREGQNIDYGMLRDSDIPLPPKEEQDQIVRYLDSKLAKINRYIKNRQKIIELLKEKIEYYVYFDGESFNPTIKLWDISFPKKWNMVKANRIFQEVNIKNQPDKDLLAVTQDRGVLYKNECEQNYVSPSGDLSGLKLVRENDYIISLRSFQGGIEFSNIEGIVSPAYNIFCLRTQFNQESYRMYYKYLFKTRAFIVLLNTLVAGIRDGKNISYSDFSQLLMPVPPVEHVEKLMKLIKDYESIKGLFEKELPLLNEYRTSLISAVVTGKVDVRNIEVEDSLEEI